MKYFLDTEFLEGSQQEKFPISLFRKQTPNTIDLISIGIVAEDGREYYAISKDFNLKEAWNRYQMEYRIVDSGRDKRDVKVYWIRKNVLRPIYNELNTREWNDCQKALRLGIYVKTPVHNFTYKELKRLLIKYGKTNDTISKEVRDFAMETGIDYGVGPHTYMPIEFYAYYADYDWVVFCWLFGKMMDLPTGFPMYCKDLKQLFDDKQEKRIMIHGAKTRANRPTYNLCELDLKKHIDYPKQENEHDALSDARWNKKLYEFLEKI